jgi:flagellar biosynthesis chaperone FliJ
MPVIQRRRAVVVVLAAAVALAGVGFAVKAIQDYRGELQALKKKLKDIEAGRRALAQQLVSHGIRDLAQGVFSSAAATEVIVQLEQALKKHRAAPADAAAPRP